MNSDKVGRFFEAHCICSFAYDIQCRCGSLAL